MATSANGPPDDDPRLAGFEHAAEPAFVTDGGRHRIVALNAAGRALWGEGGLGAEVAALLPDLDRDQLECWPWVLQSQTPVEVNAALGLRKDPVVLELRPWPGSEGSPRGVVTRLRRDLESESLATRMQESLLPEELPVLPHLDLAATCLLADAAEGAAGDWFDAVLLPSGEVALVVGDVAGRGTEAVATMAATRAVVRERLLGGCDLGEALESVARLVVGLPRAVTSTITLAFLQPETGWVTYCAAGHPPPLVVDPDGGARCLPPTGAAALGIGSTYPTRTHTLEPGQMLVLHSDGVVAAMTDTEQTRTADLAGALHSAVASIGGGHGIRGTVDRVCRRVLAEGLPGATDDRVLLVAERMPPSAPLELRLPAEPASVRAARLRLWEWLDELRPGELDVSAILHAAGELVSNAVEHAYARRDEPEDAVVLRAVLSPAGEVIVSVRDHGRWSDTAETTGRGRGLVMAAGLIDRLDLDREADGTTATLRHRIGRPVTLFRASPTGRAGRRGDPFDTAAAGSGRMRVSGEVDQESAGVLRVALLHHTAAGTAPVVADLSEVSFLSSTGVQVLAEALGWRSDPAVVAFAAAPGSVAARVLDAVGLPYADC